MRSARSFLVLALALYALAVVPARADTGCTLSGGAGSYRVARLTGGTVSSLSWLMPNVGTDTTDRSSHVLAAGLAVIGGSTFYDSVEGAGDARVYARNSGVVSVDQSVSGPPHVPLVNAYTQAYAGPDTGPLYVIAYEVGPAHNIAGRDAWTFTLGGVTCTPVDAPGEILTFDQYDFSGATDVAAPGATYGPSLHLAYTSPRNAVFGSGYAAALQIHSPHTLPVINWADLGHYDLRYHGPCANWRLQDHYDVLRPFWCSGEHNFDLTLTGVDANVYISLLEVDLPT